MWWAATVLLAVQLVYAVVAYYPMVVSQRELVLLDGVDGTVFTGLLPAALVLCVQRLTKGRTRRSVAGRTPARVALTPESASPTGTTCHAPHDIRPRHILVVGATSAVGREVAAALVAADVPVRVFVRDPARTAHLPDQGQRHVGDLRAPAEVEAALRGVRAAFYVSPHEHDEVAMATTSSCSPVSTSPIAAASSRPCCDCCSRRCCRTIRASCGWHA